MTDHRTHTPIPVKPLRLWPGVVAAALLCLSWLVIPAFVPDLAIVGVLGGVAFGLVIVSWWLLFSRAPWSERLGALALMVVGVAASSRLVHESVAGGMMGMMLGMYSVPVLGLALVSWAALSRRSSAGLRRASMVATILGACGSMTLVRTNGIDGDAVSDFEWRWTPTAEQQLLARNDEPLPLTPAPATTATAAPLDTHPPRGSNAIAAPAPTSPAAAAEKAPALVDRVTSEPGIARAEAPAPIAVEWPGFRGPRRDGAARGVRIGTDWGQTPPVELWRRAVGPGWSSFAVAGDLFYTQEQRGEDEVVSCYRLSTGEPVWRHRDAVRFWESNGGAGPRGTPTVHAGRVYTFGATGILNALDARTGALLWSRNVATDTGVAVPDWGFASSPVAVDDVVVVAASGQLVGYGRGAGERRWSGPAGGAGYSSPHLVTIDGVPQVLLLRGSRTISVAPADGTMLWEHTGELGVSIVQPALAPEGDVLIATGDGMGGGGIRRVSVARADTGWRVEERWTSRGLKPYFNDLVVHRGHAFGFDGSILASVDLRDGARTWKGGRYGHGQMILLPDQDLLLVLSEDGEIALVSAAPDRFTEIARVSALHSKTWNHPVLVGETLLVRNGEEMAAFRLPRASR
jgi:outer membrane protein assembly factor BamB